MKGCDTGRQEDQALHVLHYVPGQNGKLMDDLQDITWHLVRFRMSNSLSLQCADYVNGSYPQAILAKRPPVIQRSDNLGMLRAND